MPDLPAQGPRLKGITLAKQFPNSAEPIRGLFVLRQVLATSSAVEWSVIAPVPGAPRGLEGVLKRPRVDHVETVEGNPVVHPEYSVLPKRVRFEAAGPSMARASAYALGKAVEAGAEFVHAHALFPSGAAAAQLAGQANLPLVVSVHGSDLYTMLDRPAWRRAVENVVAAASAVICVGTKLATDVREQLGAPESKVRIIPDTYDEDVFRLFERPARSGRPLRIVSVGRLEPYKGPDVLLEAFARLADRDSLELVVVGGGSEEPRLKQLAESLGISARVRFAGPLPPGRIAEEFQAADLYVQPSRREGFGVALVEAMATGLPAVATRSGGPEDIVTAVGGVLVSPSDPDALATGIEEALARIGDFDSPAIAGDIARRYGSERIGTELVAVYREVVLASAASGDRA